MAEQKTLADSQDQEQRARITTKNLSEKGLIFKTPESGITIDEFEGRHGIFYVVPLKMNSKPVELVFSSKRLLFVMRQLQKMRVVEFRLSVSGEGFNRHFKATEP